MIKSINLFLLFNGNCKSAIEFYKEVFAAEIIECVTYGDAQMSSDESDKDLIMNSNIIISGLQISCSDNLKDEITSGNQISLWLELDSEDSFDLIYSKFNKYITKKEKTFWDSIYAKVVDNFGIIWELNYQI